MKQVSRRHMSQNFTQPAIPSLLLTFASCLMHFPSCLHTTDCVPASFHPSPSPFWRSAWQRWLLVWTWRHFYTLVDIVYVDFKMLSYEFKQIERILSICGSYGCSNVGRYKLIFLCVFTYSLHIFGQLLEVTECKFVLHHGVSLLWLLAGLSLQNKTPCREMN